MNNGRCDWSIVVKMMILKSPVGEGNNLEHDSQHVQLFLASFCRLMVILVIFLGFVFLFK